MKKTIFAILCLMAFSTMNTAIYAQDNQLNGTAKAEIRQPLILSPNAANPNGGSGGELNFGLVNSGTAVGTLVLSTSNAVTPSGGVTLSSGVNTTIAAFAISGSVGKSYALTVVTPTVSISGTSGAALANSATMTVNAFTVRPHSAGVDQLTGTLDGTGNDTFAVGGTLTVGANQDEGQYSGTFSISVAYN